MEKYEEGKSYLVCISELLPSKAQPRKYNCPEAHEELKRSIKEQGLLTPILYTMLGEDKVIVDGHRRCEAQKDLGEEYTLGVYLSTPSPVAPLVVNLIREELLPMERSEALATLKLEHGYSHETIAKLLGKSVPTVSEMLKLNVLPEDIREECRISKRYVYSRLLQIAHAPNDRARRSKFQAYKDELDGKVKKRITKGPSVQNFANKIQGLIKTIEQLERGVFNDRDLNLLAQKADELKRVVAEKINVISGLETLENRTAQCVVDIDEHFVQKKPSSDDLLGL